MMDEIMFKFKKVIEKTMDWFLYKSLSFRNYIHCRYIPKEGYLLVNEKYLKNCIYETGESRFYVTRCMESLDTIEDDYNYKDVKPDDIVVDIGANIGGFSIRIANICKHVYAVEPLFAQELENNFKLNNISDSNYTIIPYGLGNGYVELEYELIRKTVKCISFKDIKKLAGEKIDFLKIDCEGGEWNIEREDLEDIDRIEMELHCFNGEKIETFLEKLSDFTYKTKKISETTSIIHAVKK